MVSSFASMLTAHGATDSCRSGTADGGPLLAVAIGVLGGAASFVGLLLGAVFWVPRIVGALGRLLGRVSGPATALAAANIVRNPRRTAATSSAVLIGVTLVTMMATGAASARASLASELDSSYAVDVEVSMPCDPAGTGLDPDLASALVDLPGIADVAPVHAIEAIVRRADGDLHPVVAGIEANDARRVLRAPSLVDEPERETLLVLQAMAAAFDLAMVTPTEAFSREME